MTLYKKNLQTLARYYPEMDQLIETAREKMKPELSITEEFSYDGTPVLKVGKDGKELYLNGRRNPYAPAEQWVKKLGDLETNAPIFLMGTGNPTYLRELAEQTKEHLAIIVYEPSLEIFIHFLETVSLDRWMEKHLIVFWVLGLPGMNENTVTQILRKLLTFEMLPNFRHLVLPNYEILFPEETINFLKKIRKIAEDSAVLYRTNLRFSTVYVKNLLSNARYVCKGYKTTQLLEVVPRDIPGILVAAGPSLNKNIQELKKAKGRAFILAVDTAIKPLLNAGIIPDMFAIVDGKKPLELIKREEARDIPLFTTISAASEVLDYHTGKKFFYDEGQVIIEKIFAKSGQRFGSIATGGSVATSAFSLLHKIGLTRIILVGQDLAFTGNKSHADGTFHKIMKEENTKHFIMVPGNVEEQVPTRGDFKLYLDWYNQYIPEIQKRKKDFRVINATEGGARIVGTEVMTLREAIEKECGKEVDLQERFASLPPMLDKEKQMLAWEELRGIAATLGELRTESQKALKLYQKLDKICARNNIDKKEYLNLLKKLDKAVKRIEKKKDVYQLVTQTMVNAQHILRSEQFLHENSVQKEGKEIARKGILYMQNVVEIAGLFEEYAQELYAKNECDI